MRAVAQAMKDMSLFEKATLLCSPQPNPLQMAEIIKFALSIEDLVRAQHWLDQTGWTEHKALYKDLTSQLLRLQGNVAQIKKTASVTLKMSQTITTLLTIGRWQQSKSA
jgi:hypothetical protein